MNHDEFLDLADAVRTIEQGWWKVAPSRDAAIGKLTGLTPSKYYMLLSTLLDDPEFWRMDPVLVDRLRRLRTNKLSERDQDSSESGGSVG